MNNKIGSLLIFCFLSKLISCLAKDDDDEYGETLDALVTVYNKSKQLYITKQKDYFSKYYEKPIEKDISMNTSNLMKADETTNKSFRKLNAIANNPFGGEEKLKSNGMLKNTLKIMLNDNTMKIRNRVDAAKLAVRLNDIPVTIQIASNDPNKKPSNINSYVVVPRIKRLYRADYYVENYKAGNWDA